MINSFGIATDPLRFRQLLPEVALEPFREALRFALNALTDRAEIIEKVLYRWWSLLAQDFQSERMLIELLRAEMQECSIGLDSIEQALVRRAKSIEDLVRPFVVGQSLLDWGCGDGRVAAGLPAEQVTLLDIEDRRVNKSVGCFYVYDEEEMPQDLVGHTSDTVLLGTVLHHARNPGLTIRHCTHVARRRLIVIESVPSLQHPSLSGLREDFLAERVRYEYCGFVDWLYNRVFCEDVQVTFNYLPTAAWVQIFEAAGFSLTHIRDLGIDQQLVPEWHVLLIFDRAGTNRMGARSYVAL